MPNIVIAGAQWGDEGKGKIVDLLSERFQVVARYNGGHNAGHTVQIGAEQFILHLIPSGILHEGVLNVMGNGMVIDPWALEREIAELQGRGVSIGENLVISDRAHLVLPHHRAVEALSEEQLGEHKIGTTLRGIGPAYEDKAARRGVRMGDLLRPEGLEAKLRAARQHYEQLSRGAGREPEIDWAETIEQLVGFGARLGRFIGDTAAVLHREMAAGYSVLFEGAQATLLDIDFGTYPFVTSSSACTGGVSTGLGIPPTRIDGALGIVKAYTTRVGGGPLPTEIGGRLEEEVRTRGAEFGASTGRPRRCGWFDALVVRHSARLNGFETLALTKLDVLDNLVEIPVCTGYRFQGEVLDSFPADLTVLQHCEPVYETLPGWTESTAGMCEWVDLPENARAYVERLAALVGAEIGIVSTGPERGQTIFRSSNRLAGWLQ